MYVCMYVCMVCRYFVCVEGWIFVDTYHQHVICLQKLDQWRRGDEPFKLVGRLEQIGAEVQREKLEGNHPLLLALGVRVQPAA